jgi:hypothetical protein
MTADADGGEVRLRAVVAIPAKNEQRLLGECLRALSAQRDLDGRPLSRGVFGIVVLLNDCEDESATLARSMAASLDAPMRVVECELPAGAAHAGGARRRAMDLAAAWLEQSRHDGLLLTTDADSRVGPSWIADNLAAAEEGVDAVAGSIALDVGDELALPETLRERGDQESVYEQQLIEIGALLDPRPHNPWPHHATMSGASLAVKLSAYRRIGGLPPLPVGEDKALIAALEAHDARVRFAPEICVVTSGRLHGRAAGGVADTIRLRCEHPDALCDEMLEPAGAAAFRAHWRARLRALHAEGRLGETEIWAPGLGLDPENALGAAGTARFGVTWGHVERTSPMLPRRRLAPADLPRQIRRASGILDRLRAASRARDHIQPKSLGPRLEDDRSEAADFSEEDLGGVVA